MLVGCERQPVDLAYQRGLNAVADGRFDLARGYFAEHLVARPDDLAARRQLGRAWMSGPLQSPSQARAVWEAVLEEYPDDAEARRGLADALYLLGDAQGALSQLEGVAVGAEVDALRAKILLQSDPSAALDFARQRLAQGGESGLALVAAQASELLGESDAALADARAAVLAEPLSATAHYLLSRSLLRAGDEPGARQEAELHRQLLALAMDPRGASAVPLERLRAVERLMEAFDPVPAALRRLRLETMIAAGLRADARSALAAMLADQESGASASQLADWAERLGDLEAARGLLTTAQEEASDAGERNQIRHRLARILRRLDPAAAEDLLRRALAEDPGIAPHHCMLAEMLAERRENEAAAASFARALELAPWRDDCRLGWASLYQARGERREVERILAAAPEPSPLLRRFRQEHGYAEP
jgi:thioredoxin-like negative regulator of GroEL